MTAHFASEDIQLDEDDTGARLNAVRRLGMGLTIRENILQCILVEILWQLEYISRSPGPALGVLSYCRRRRIKYEI